MMLGGVSRSQGGSGLLRLVSGANISFADHWPFNSADIGLVATNRAEYLYPPLSKDVPLSFLRFP